ncbi:hypothetical protein PENARI_c025G02422 [Penicillium arizonense]|uniref:Uncharacterized protein n=1 Tax=Penicillium arizonense TaxID=1835702 RepID=A0A1F5L6P0_PENAI|nr:hypothetical protein PENARI_c025G02422 [Penicillium arizonense]OGE48894.1 hypothetical protein PENARI_c025G02422 [Penicillium arizonense]
MAIEATNKVSQSIDRKVAKYPRIIRLFLPKKTQGRRKEDYLNEQESRHTEKAEWTLTHSYFANMGGLYFKGKDEEASFPLTAFQYAQEPGNFDLPDIDENGIQDKSKQDIFLKALAVLQISQLCLSLIVRRTRGLPFSQLETLTLGFAVCAVGTYSLYWYKPQGVGVPITVTSNCGKANFKFKRHHDSFVSVLMNEEGNQDVKTIHRIKNDNIPLGASNTTHVAVPLLAVMSTAFGCFHIIAWNFAFPTDIELLLWKIATVLSITIPAIGLATVPLTQWTIRTGGERKFMRGCLELLRELHWHKPDRQFYLRARRRLESIYNNPDPNCVEARQLYREVLTDASTDDELLQNLQELESSSQELKEKGYLDLSNDLDPPKFWGNFNLLCQLMKNANGTRAPKRLVETAQTNVFPRESLLPRWVNLFFIYASSLIYCVSRLTILALALSSLRSMPEGVYITTWTQNIPAVH